MKSVQTLLVILVLTILAAGCTPLTPKKSKMAIPLPAGTLNTAEVTALFSGQTAHSVLDSNGRISLTYYSPSGLTNQSRKGKIRHGSWRVRNDGRICLAFEGGNEKCRIIVKEGDIYRKYIVKKNGKHERIISYKSFRAGDLVK